MVENVSNTFPFIVFAISFSVQSGMSTTHVLHLL